MVLFNDVVEILIRTITIVTGQQYRFSILLTAIILTVFAPLLSMTILRGRRFASSAPVKNFVAAAWSQFAGSMMSIARLNLSTAR